MRNAFYKPEAFLPGSKGVVKASEDRREKPLAIRTTWKMMLSETQNHGNVENDKHITKCLTKNA